LTKDSVELLAQKVLVDPDTFNSDTKHKKRIVVKIISLNYNYHYAIFSMRDYNNYVLIYRNNKKNMG